VTALLLALAAAGTFAVGMITAGGAAMLLVPVVGWLCGAAAVAPVVTVATMGSGVSRILMLRRSVRWDLVRWYLPAALLGAFLGARLFATLVREHADSGWIELLLGLFLLSMVLQFRFGRRRGMRLQPWVLGPVGFVVAGLSGLVGGTGPVLNPFYLGLDVQREELIATKAFNALMVHLTKVGTYAAFGALDLLLLSYGLAAAVGAVGGNLLGRRWLRAMGERRFRGLVVAMMAVAGLLLLWQGWQAQGAA
jgi:uncharacterized membrane protein YfcA